MNEETTEETQETGKGLRAQLEAANKTIKGLRIDQRAGAFKEAGIDTESGLGKAISQMYEGEGNVESIAKFAKDEYGWEKPVVEETHPQAAQIQQEQGRLDQVGLTAGSVVTPGETDVLAEAEAKGDYGTTMAIKGQQVADMFRTRR